MKQITLNLDDETFDSADSLARQTGASLSSLILGIVRQVVSARDSEFDQLARQEAQLHRQLRTRGTAFAAGNRLTRDELYNRHEIR